MKKWSRIIAIFFTLLIMAISLLLVLQVFRLVSPERIGLPVWLTERILPLDSSDWPTRLLFGSIYLSFFLAGSVFLYFELRPFFSGGRRFLVSQDELGKVEITEDSIGKFIDYEARLFGEISKISSQIIKRKDGLHIKSLITVGPETHIAELGEALQDHLKNKLENNFGLLISSIVVTAKINQKAGNRILKDSG